MDRKYSEENDGLSFKRNSYCNKRSDKNFVFDVTKKNKIKFDLMNRKWKVFRVSPIYNFTNKSLKFFEKKLNEEMNSKKNETPNALYKSKFSLNKNLRSDNQSLEGLQVELFKNECQRVYLGVFFSWNGSDSTIEDSVSLPILLVEAKAYEMHSVHSFLCKIFDCDIQPVTFSFYAMTFFFVKLLETERNSVDVSQEQVIMEFRVPGCEIYDKIKISLNLQDTVVVLAVVMDNLQEKYKEFIALDIIWEFYNKILNHIYQIFKMDLTYAELQKIAFPDAFLTTDGQLKMSTDYAVISSLNVLKCFTPLDAVISQ